MAEVEQLIDASLRRMFVPPAQPVLDRIVDQVVAQIRPAVRPTIRVRGIRRLAAAAAIAAGLVGGWQVWRVAGPGAGAPAAYRHQPWRSLDTVYRDTVASGFEPGWVCADDREFVLTFKSLHHQGLVLADTPPRFEAVGLLYCNSITPRTIGVLLRVEGRPVIVFVDRVERDTVQPKPSAGINVFRRQIGRLVLYELSPLSEPLVLPLFHDPEVENRR